MLGYSVPLHDKRDTLAELVLPRDLSEAECVRLCTFLRTLVLRDNPPLADLSSS